MELEEKNQNNVREKIALITGITGQVFLHFYSKKHFIFTISKNQITNCELLKLFNIL